jgi:predicted permease
VSPDERLDDEIRHHLDLLAAEHEARGMSPAQARDAARRAFGRIEPMKERHRDVRGFRVLGDLGRDVRFGARLLMKDRWFTLAAVLVLALGIASTNTVFTLVNGILLRDLPFADPNGVVQMGRLSYPDWQDWQARQRTFETIGGAAERDGGLADDGRPAERVRMAYVSSNTFALLGRRPMLGRDFRDDDAEGAAPVVILGHSVWRTRYARRPDIVGRTVRVNGIPSVVVGVMPEGFEFPTNAKLWQPLALLPPAQRDNRGARGVDAFGRVRAGLRVEQATADIRGIAAALAREYPDERRALMPRVEPFRSGIGGPVVEMMTAMMGAGLLVLLIACANVANLVLARGSVRAREVSVRMSIGASRWRVVRQLLVESLLLAGLAGGVALALSAASIRLFWNVVSQVPDPPPFWLRFPIDGQVFAFLAAVCLGTSVLFGLVPALHTSKTNLVEALNDGGKGSAGRRRGRRWSGVLVAGQLALALVLLTGAGIIMRDLVGRVRAAAGVDTSRLIRMGIELPAAVYASPEQRLLFYRELDDRLTTLRGVRAAIASAIPLGGGDGTWLLFEGRDEPPARDRPIVTTLTIGPRYFETIGAPLVRGRGLAASDGVPGAGAAIVNERFEDMYFDGGSALGRRVQVGAGGADWLTIVGVAGNVRQQMTVSGDFDPVVYLPYAASPVPRTLLLLRADVDVAQASSLLRETVRSLDADIPVYDIRTVDEHLAMARWGQRVFGSVFMIFALIAVALAIVGLYAVTSYAVSQRTQEIGVRMALGAGARHIWWIVARHASAQLAAGLVIGGAGAAAVSRVVPAMLGGSSEMDIATMVAVAGLLLATGLGACLVPARRAMRLDPVAALRNE